MESIARRTSVTTSSPPSEPCGSNASSCSSPISTLTTTREIAFAGRFGDLTESHPVEPQVLERKEVHSIESGKDRTDFWHTDITFMTRPAMASMLRSVEVPERGRLLYVGRHSRRL